MEMPDKRIQQILSSVKPIYDPSYWEAANAYLQKRKRKKRLWFFFGLSGLIIGVGSALFLAHLHDGQHFAPETRPLWQPAHETHSETKPLEIPIAQESIDTPVAGTKQDNKAFNKDTREEVSKSTNRRSIASSNGLSTSSTRLTIQTIDVKSVAAPAAMAFEDVNNLPSNHYTESTEAPRMSNETHAEYLTDNQDPFIQEMTALPINLSMVSRSSESYLLPSDKVSIKQLRNYWKYRGYMGSAAIFNPSWDENELFGIGFSIGGGLEAAYGQHFFGTIGLSYLHRWGTFNVMIDHPTPQYGFVKDDKGYSLVPTDAAYAELPIQIGIRRQQFRFGVGISVMRLLGAKGRVFSYQSEPLETNPGAVVYRSTPVSSGWIETPGFRKWITGIEAFTEYQLNNSLLMGCSFKFMPQGLVKADYQYKYQNETGNYERIQTAGLLENRYHLSLFVKYTL